ncbi:TlpA family protein disulfide reductase [Rhodoblastus acidophilus]|uniref:TlpA family protein disulfide reductase n=1 Tax=Candidatus Rhodoblastus alkanivorans TaxID=2954117 RepID=A0ABS9Z1C9_9HYPH|nr:TlpA disulfide reductase family protein [Candidatus Rhodoblastus alkanivorans]MCI4679410.1 TlpA family protein disulfide reductase [Candidatus Rhodoblastus alkanivorans]MCI4681418.1 TlpA family protein disulfide reductase [Candidatus Rhodoblastus alkanivorans]MDI4642466.1 TlpA family protein disulfide reductase [Rhodoblastus acidophilus]
MNDEQEPQPQADPAKMRALARRLVLPHVFLVAALIAAALWFVLYEMKGGGSKEAATFAAQCPVSTPLAAKLAPLAKGEMAALAIHAHPRPMPALSFLLDGAATDVAAFKGRTILLNFWATWCVPCRQEMPSLDRLEGAEGDKSFSVVAVNVDTARLDRPKAFLKEIGVKNLGFYADPKGKVIQVLQQTGKLVGLPTTFLVGPDGCEIGAMAGPAEWDSADAAALIRATTQK